MDENSSPLYVEGVVTMNEQLYRDTWAEVNLQAIEHNVKAIRAKLPGKTHIMAVVKANGYGHGSIAIARRALASGATHLAVALLEEAITLREAGIDAPILVMGWVSAEHAPIAAKHRITLTVFQEDWLKNVPRDLLQPLHVHMKWDTGMGRLGITSTDALRRFVGQIKQYDHIKLTGVFTHFATADGEDLSYYHEQRKRFQVLLDEFAKLWPEKVALHIGNSAASIRFPKNMYHYIRFGVAMYGLYPSLAVKAEQTIDLKRALTLHTRLSHVKYISKGDSISYGQTYVAKEDEWIGTLPIGYADGWRRKLQGFHVLVDGKRMPIVGRICMDQMMIKLDQQYPIGTKVTLIGKQRDEEISADDVAEYLETINYEIPCMLTSRIPRVYIDKDV